jgi:hypothetical protein
MLSFAIVFIVAFLLLWVLFFCVCEHGVDIMVALGGMNLYCDL